MLPLGYTRSRKIFMPIRSSRLASSLTYRCTYISTNIYIHMNEELYDREEAWIQETCKTKQEVQEVQEVHVHTPLTLRNPLSAQYNSYFI